MSTSISSLSIRTTVPSTTSPCLKLLMSVSCSASSSSIVVGSGPVRRVTGAGASSSSSSAAGGASATSSARSWRSAVGRLGLGSGRPPGRPRRPPRRPRSWPRPQGRRRPPGRPGGLGRRPRGASSRRGPPYGLGSAASATAASGASAARGLVGLGGGLGCLGGAAGSSATAIAATVCSDAGVSLEATGLRRRRGPALLLVGQGDPCLLSWIPPRESRTASEHTPGAVLEREWIGGELGRRSAPSR